MATLVDSTDLTSDENTTLATVAAELGITSAALAVQLLKRQIELEATESLFTQSDLELRMGGPRYLVQLCDDNGDGVADVAAVRYIKAEATKIVQGLLWGAWPSESQIKDLVGRDAGLLGFTCDIAAGLAGSRRPEWVTADGKPFFEWRYARGVKELRNIQEGRVRTSSEATVGTNETLFIRTEPAPPATRQFLPTRELPKGRGGF